MRRLLLDTHAFLWWVEGTPALPRKARAAIEDPDNDCLFSLASAWELAIKASLGKLKLTTPVQRFVIEQVAANRFKALDVSLSHIGRVETLDRIHGDPFDRLLVAQALEDGLTIVTADPVFRRYGVACVWR